MNEENNISKDNKVDKKQSNFVKAKNGMLGGLVLGIILAVITYSLYYYLYTFTIVRLIYIIGFCSIICFITVISSYIDWKEAKKIEKLNVRNEEREFAEIDISKRELRAEKMFKMNQKELMRYYDMNLAQTKFLSFLGILMIIVIVSVSIFLYNTSDLDIILFVNYDL